MKTYLVSIKNGSDHGEGMVEAKNSVSAYRKAIDQYKDYLLGDHVTITVEERK